MEATNPSLVLTFWDLQPQKLLKNNGLFIAQPIIVFYEMFCSTILLSSTNFVCCFSYSFRESYEKILLQSFFSVHNCFNFCMQSDNLYYFYTTFLCDSSITFIHLYAVFLVCFTLQFLPKNK